MLNVVARYVALMWALPSALTILAVGSDWELEEFLQESYRKFSLPK